MYKDVSCSSVLDLNVLNAQGKKTDKRGREVIERRVRVARDCCTTREKGREEIDEERERENGD